MPATENLMRMVVGASSTIWPSIVLPLVRMTWSLEESWARAAGAGPRIAVALQNAAGVASVASPTAASVRAPFANCVSMYMIDLSQGAGQPPREPGCPLTGLCKAGLDNTSAGQSRRAAGRAGGSANADDGSDTQCAGEFPGVLESGDAVFQLGVVHLVEDALEARAGGQAHLDEGITGEERQIGRASCRER